VKYFEITTTFVYLQNDSIEGQNWLKVNPLFKTKIFSKKRVPITDTLLKSDED
jgi:hypothetical protein